MTALRAAKKELRRQIKRALAELSQESIQSQTRLALKKLFALPQYQHARRISVYLSMPSGEISTVPIVHDALDSGKDVFIPYYYKRQAPKDGEPASIMDMLELQSLEDYRDLKLDNWGIPTPSEESIPERANSFGGKGKSEGELAGENQKGLDLIIMPGMAFDSRCGRLGHGKGFYDLFLERTRKSLISGSRAMPYLVGLALKEQLLPAGETVPMDATDWKLDAIIVGDGSVLMPKTDAS